MYILLMVTYLGGHAAGPNVSMQEYSSAESCDFAKVKAKAMIDGLIQANLQSYRPLATTASAECIKK